MLLFLVLAPKAHADREGRLSINASPSLPILCQHQSLMAITGGTGEGNAGRQPPIDNISSSRPLFQGPVGEHEMWDVFRGVVCVEASRMSERARNPGTEAGMKGGGKVPARRQESVKVGKVSGRALHVCKHSGGLRVGGGHRHLPALPALSWSALAIES